MANYGKLFSRIWTDPEFTALDAPTQQLYCLLISHSTRDHAGVLPMALRRWARSTHGATATTVRAALSVLVERGFVVADWDTEEVLVRSFIRNDEVYKQPQVMRSALKSAAVVESETLRWALHDEIERFLADITDERLAEETGKVSKALVEGTVRTLPELLPPDPDDPARRLPAGCPQALGVGGYLSGVREAPTPTPATFTHTHTSARNGAELARARFASIPTRTARPSTDIVAEFSAWLGTPLDDKTATETAAVVDACLTAGQSRQAIEAGMVLWSKSDSWAPSQIPKFITKAAARRKHHSVGKATEKALGYDELAAELIDELGNQ